MRRKDREVKDFDKIIEIISHCDILRLGLADSEFPYIVPVNFSYTVLDGVIKFYIHGAMVGRKYELLKKNGFCSFEADNPLGIDLIYSKKAVTMRYESVMGKAEVGFLEKEEKQSAIDKIIMARYSKTRDFEYNVDVLSKTAVAELTVTEITAKANPFSKESD